MTQRLSTMFALNPDFKAAYERGEKWAILQVEAIRGIDGEANRRHPERAFEEDGRPHHWCGTCAHESGCIVCDLDGDYEGMKGMIRKYKD